MKLGKKKLIVGMICLILCFSMTACSEETAKNLAQDIDDQVSNLKDIDESHVVSVRTGCPVLYPNIRCCRVYRILYVSGKEGEGKIAIHFERKRQHVYTGSIKF